MGSSFDGSKWKHLKTEDYYNNNGLFYWLHQAGLYGNAQLDLARSLVEDKSIPHQDQVMKITNENADSEYIYTPYEVKQVPGVMPLSGKIQTKHFVPSACTEAGLTNTM